MAFLKNNVKTEIQLGTSFGGDIDSSYLTFKINESMKKIFIDAHLLSLPRYIDPRDGLKVQPIAVDGSEVILNNPPEGSDYVQHTNLYEVTWDTSAISGTSDYILENVKTRTLVNPNDYYIGQDVAGSSEEKLIFKEDYKSTGNYSLELFSFYSSTENGHVQPSFARDFYDALLAEVKYCLYSSTGRPYSSPEMARIERQIYMQHLSNLKIKSNKDYQMGTDIKVKQNKFI
jgi:hypothetical protein